jgi:4-hydroxybenzoate polyprenyltransferase
MNKFILTVKDRIKDLTKERIGPIKEHIGLLAPLQNPKIWSTIRLMRLDKPIGTLLVMWPMLWALWLAAGGAPPPATLCVFLLGALLMRSAGCVINDYADRNIDGHVSRTQQRPLATGELSAQFALILFAVLVALSFLLVLATNKLTIITAVGALILASAYPFMKRYTHLPQIVLGAAFAWAIPMAFTAVTATLPKPMWTLYLGALIWTVAYDTFYAMVDREDDEKIGVKSTAILFAENDRVITGCLQAFTLMVLLTVGRSFQLHWPFYLSLVVAAGLFGYQQWLIKERQPARCFEAFLNNNWVGMVIFVGILLSYLIAPPVPIAEMALQP